MMDNSLANLKNNVPGNFFIAKLSNLLEKQTFSVQNIRHRIEFTTILSVEIKKILQIYGIAHKSNCLEFRMTKHFFWIYMDLYFENKYFGPKIKIYLLPNTKIINSFLVLSIRKLRKWCNRIHNWHERPKLCYFCPH